MPRDKKKATAWVEDWWNVPDNIRMGPESKAIFAYLKTGYKNTTGIYTRTLEEIAFKTGVEIARVRHLITSGAVVGIEYDDTVSAVFVVSQFEDNEFLGGNIEWVRQGILRDFYQCLGARALWLRFAEVYRDTISESAVLADHFERIRAGVDPIALARPLDKTPPRDIDREIQKDLERYFAELPDDKNLGAFLEIYTQITKGRSKEFRARFLADVREYPTDHIAEKSLSLLASSYPGRILTRDLFARSLKGETPREGGDSGQGKAES
jgi:hypothetical protein